jgi:hypothetical protein
MYARSSCNARTEPSNNAVGVAVAGRCGSLANIEVTLPSTHGPALLDICMTQPRCPTYVAALHTVAGTVRGICTLVCLLSRL